MNLGCRCTELGLLQVHGRTFQYSWGSSIQNACFCRNGWEMVGVRDRNSGESKGSCWSTLQCSQCSLSCSFITLYSMCITIGVFNIYINEILIQLNNSCKDLVLRMSLLISPRFQIEGLDRIKLFDQVNCFSLFKNAYCKDIHSLSLSIPFPELSTKIYFSLFLLYLTWSMEQQIMVYYYSQNMMSLSLIVDSVGPPLAVNEGRVVALKMHITMEIVQSFCSHREFIEINLFSS